MSFGGILATALAGGAGVIGKQAGDDIEAGRRADLMKQQADIEEQMRMRLAEFSEKQRRSGVLYDTTGEGGAAKREYRKGELADASDAAISQARNMIPVAVEQATAVAGAQRDAVTKSGSDPAYIKALRAISAANAAPDRTDYKGRELDNAIKQMQVDNAARADGLRKEFGKATPERQQQIKDELSILTGKDADKFVPVPLKDADGAISGYQVFDTKSGKFVDAGAGKGGGAPAVGTEVGGYVFNGGDPNDKKNWTAKAAGKQAGRGMLSSVTPAPEPDYRLASDGSGRMVDVTTGRTLTPEQSAVLQKIELGEPTTPGERALLKN
jgi:hypothetical protein